MPLAFPLPLATTGEPPALPSICVQTAMAQSAAENTGMQSWGRDTEQSGLGCGALHSLVKEGGRDLEDSVLSVPSKS